MADATHLAFGLISGSSFAGSPVTSTHALALTSGTDVGVKFSVNAHKSTGGSPSVTAVTYNGVSCTQVGVETAYGSGSPDGHFSEWWCPRPDTSASHDIVVTYSGTPSAVYIYWEEVEHCHASTLPVQEAVYTGSFASGTNVSVSAPNTLGAAFATVVEFGTRGLFGAAISPSDATISRTSGVGVPPNIPARQLLTVASASTPYTATFGNSATSTYYYVISVVRIPGAAASTPQTVVLIQ